MTTILAEERVEGLPFCLRGLGRVYTRQGMFDGCRWQDGGPEWKLSRH